MATDTDAVQEFGRVSRVRGIAFKYVLLAATLVGIVSLGVLLAYVFADAVQPFAADPGWYLAFALTFALPTVALGAYYLRQNRAAGAVGATALGLVGSGLMVGAGVAVLFVDVVEPLAWLAYVVGLALPAAVYLGYRRVRPDGSLPERAVVAAGLFGYSLFGIPGYIHSAPEIVLALPTVPTGWVILLVTLGGPAAALAGTVVAAREGSRRAGVAVGGAVFATVGLAGAVALLAGFGPLPWVVLALTAVVPTGLYAAHVVNDRPRERVGLALPAVVVGGVLAGVVLVDLLGFAGPNSWLTWQFLTSPHSNVPAEAGIYPALVGSVLLMLVVALLSFPLGVGAAVYLEEYAPDNRYTRIVEVNISNLAGVPSVVYGLLGLGVFVGFGGLTLGALVVAGMTLSLLILPIVVISAQEAIRSVPDSLRQASYGMGATKWQTIRNVVLPRALPGILTGTILALGRAIGETAPLIMVGVPQVVRAVPQGLTDKTSALPMQLFVWATTFADPAFYTTALAAGVVTLLVVLVTMNSVAIVLRNRYQNEAQS